MYNKDQWISSFEDAMTKLRPHVTTKLLTTMALSAWIQYGRKDVDPHQAAKEWSTSLDRKPNKLIP